jgi:hypothetical protein
MCQLIKPMEQSLSWDANIHSPNQEITRLLMETEGTIPCWEELATGPYPEPDAPTLNLPTLFSNIILPSIPRFSEWPLVFRFSNQNTTAPARIETLF